MLQKLETKQFQDLAVKAQSARDQTEKRFDQEMTVVYNFSVVFLYFCYIDNLQWKVTMKKDRLNYSDFFRDT